MINWVLNVFLDYRLNRSLPFQGLIPILIRFIANKPVIYTRESDHGTCKWYEDNGKRSSVGALWVREEDRHELKIIYCVLWHMDNYRGILLVIIMVTSQVNLSY